jgi:hypothetical protein
MRAEQFSPACVIEAIRRHHGMVTQTAQALRCRRQTVLNYCRRYPEVAAALREERKRLLDEAELALYRAIEAGEGWAITFYLKCQGKDRGYGERREITGKNGDTPRVYLTWPDPSD